MKAENQNGEELLRLCARMADKADAWFLADFDLHPFEALDALVAEHDRAIAEERFWSEKNGETAGKLIAAEAERDRYRAALERIASGSPKAMDHDPGTEIQAFYVKIAAFALSPAPQEGEVDG